MSPAFSRESKNSSENSIPKSILCEQPAHFHRFVIFCFCFRLDMTSLEFKPKVRWRPLSTMNRVSTMLSRNLFFSWSRLSRSAFVSPFRFELGSQPHDKSLPWLQALATLWTTPAAAIAWTNALSRYPEKLNSHQLQSSSSRQYFKQIFSIVWQITSLLFIPLSFYRFFFVKLSKDINRSLNCTSAQQKRKTITINMCARTHYLYKWRTEDWCKSRKSVNDCQSPWYT